MRRGWAACGLVLAGLAGAMTGPARAQQPAAGFAGTGPAATDLSPADQGGVGLGAGLGLRGTAAGFDDDGAFAEPLDAAPTPDLDTGRRPALRPSVRPDDGAVPAVRQGAPRLPRLAPYPGATGKPRGATLDTADQPVAPGPTVAALPVPPPARRPRPDPTPFAPVGIPLGSLRVTPFAEQSLGFDSNPDQTAARVKPSGFSRTEGGFGLLSEWSSNELRANMHGAYTEFFADPAANRPDAAGTVDYRYDAGRDLALDTEGRFAVTTQRPGSPELGVDLKDRPLVTSAGASAGGAQVLGRFTLALHGSFDRTIYENGTLPDGATVRLDDQTFNDYGVTARASYEVTPGLRPFVQVSADTRVHDRRVDYAGFARDSDGVSGLLGASFELTRLITGEAGVGYGTRTYEDPRLRDLSGPLVDASLAYAVTPLTTLTLTAATSFNETDVAGSPGTQSRLASLQVSHALLRNLTLTGLVSYLNTDYVDAPITENAVSTTLKASYSLSRTVVLDASYNHETLNSSLPASSFDQDVVLLGLRVQR